MVKVELQNLEKIKAELLARIEQENEQTRAKCDALATLIFELENKAEKAKNNSTVQGAPQTDIYSAESILEAGKDDIEALLKRVALFYKAYAQNPYTDENNAAPMIKLLEELQGVAGDIDEYHKSEIAKATAEYERAKKALSEAQKKRSEHRRDILRAQRSITETILHSCIGNNELTRHGANIITCTPNYSLAGSNMDGANIINMLITAIKNEVATAKAQREKAETIATATTPTAGTLNGQPVAVFDTKENKGGFFDFIKPKK